MRIWDIPTKQLCNKHLTAQWHEMWAIWHILNNPKSKSPYLNHPEVKRCKRNGLAWLWWKMLHTRAQGIFRNFKFKPCPVYPDVNLPKKVYKWQTIKEQKALLKSKGCKCEVKKWK